MGKIYSSPLKNYLTSAGFVAVSNLLLDYQLELGLTEGELLFIIKVLRHKDGFVIHDDNLDQTVSSRTLSRRRNSLREKGYLTFNIVKKQDEKGCYITEGISYDFSPLEEKLQKLANKITEKTETKFKKAAEESGRKIEDENIQKFKEEYEEYYGVPYNLNDFEYKKYEELPEEEKHLIKRIFEYCKCYDLLGTIVPRLSLFFKSKFRFDELKEFDRAFPEDNKFQDNTNLIEEVFNDFGFKKEEKNKHFPFYSALERIINKTCDNYHISTKDKFPKSTIDELDRVFNIYEGDN